MPTYDYNCEECGANFELRLKFSDEVDQPCGNCGAIAKRQFSAVPIVFKGSGWYVNDYGKKSSSAGKGSDGASTDSKESSKSSDSKQNKNNETKASEKSSSSKAPKSSSTKPTTTSKPSSND